MRCETQGSERSITIMAIEGLPVRFSTIGAGMARVAGGHL